MPLRSLPELVRRSARRASACGDLVLGPGTPAAVAQTRPASDGEAVRAYQQAVARSAFVRDLLARRLPFEWARARLVSDDPAKALGRAGRGETLWTRLQALLPRAQRELQLVSPYFVPTASGTEYLAALARRGVEVSVLTNALESTDVPAVHAGYARRRKPLLEAGVRLFELRRDPAEPKVRGRGTVVRRPGAPTILTCGRRHVKTTLGGSADGLSGSLEHRQAEVPVGSPRSTEQRGRDDRHRR